LEGLFNEKQFAAAMIVDKNGIITSVSETYLDVLKLSREEVIGKPVKEITPHTRVHTVLETGKAIIGYNWRVRDRNMIASSIPVFIDNEIYGVFAYSVFMDIMGAKELIENLLTELNMYKDEVQSLHTAKYNFEDIIGESRTFQDLKCFAKQIANHSYTTVLITGESGTGKELFANAIHNFSSRSRSPFLRINCAAIPENLLEAELFGYEEGAYSGAKKGGKPGKFELANGGTIFLDEIGEMSLAMQSKLLVVLQEQEIERLGGSYPVRVDVRVIAATNRNLERMIKAGEFREDLYYRLNVVHLEMISLRERCEDIPVLTRYFMCRLNIRLKTSIRDISRESLELLYEHPWPGNVRELENVLERAMILADMENMQCLHKRHFAFLDKNVGFKVPSNTKNLKIATQDFEKGLIIQVLRETGFDRTKAANKLDIDLSSLYRKLKKYDISGGKEESTGKNSVE